MKYSLFRFSDFLQAYVIYLFCFSANLGLVHVQTLKLERYPMLKSFLENIISYQPIFIFSLTLLQIIFHLQFLIQKKTEIYCRILVGDTNTHLTLRYLLDSLIILIFSYLVSLILVYYLKISIFTNIYLFALFIIYILISSIKVRIK